MEIIREAINLGVDVITHARDVTHSLNLEEENTNGMFSNLTLLSLLLTSVLGDRKICKGRNTFKDEYDYIIAGGGSAGAVMAGRLSENPCISVLLLEAGGEPPLLTEVPSYGRIFYGTSIDWMYKTTPQKHSSFAHVENRTVWNSGRVLGGGSTINAMMYARGNKKNYDDWAAGGATGWSYDEVFPYFLKLENNVNIADLDKGYHNDKGPQTAERSHYTPEIKGPILKATKDMGYEVVDINGRRSTGMYDLQGTIRNQQRCSTAKAYLEPARDRENLDIMTYAFVRKILIKKTNGKNKAYAVEFDHKGAIHTVRVRREVIVSVGAVRTPQLLMLSGIGPRKQLKKFKIPVVVDSPAVGKNLQDHWATSLVYTIDRTITPLFLKMIDPVNIAKYVFKREGPLTSINEITLLAFLDEFNRAGNESIFPTKELYFTEYTVLDIKYTYDMKPEVFNKVFKPYIGRACYMCYATILQPYGRGEIRLKSTNPHDPPIINPNYYIDKRDLKEMIEAMKVCNAVAKHPAMREVQAELLPTQEFGFPGCEKFQGSEDDYLGCLAQSITATVWHPSGTARMGHPDDPKSVVDPELRVIGVKNIRVVNAAIFPIIPSGNPNVPTIMVAEKASDLIKRDINCTNLHQEHNSQSFPWSSLYQLFPFR